jgi:transposase-like protein
MDRDWLEQQLADGRSIEAIARDLGRHPSSVAYWVHKHGLASMHAARHAPRGGIDSDALRELVEQGLSIRAIAGRLGVSPTTVRHWLARHELHTSRAQRLRLGGASLQEPVIPCPTHGPTPHVRGSDGYWRCRRCRAEAVIRRRAQIRTTLIAEAGGACARCGYSEHPAALQFHHLDPATKAFTLRNGDTRSLTRMRAEAAKCVLLCANCHAQVEAGDADIALRSAVHERLPG